MWEVMRCTAGQARLLEMVSHVPHICFALCFTQILNLEFGQNEFEFINLISNF